MTTGEPHDHPTLAQQYRDERSAFRIGVACSGGGIRSAAFNLGALQALQEDDFLPNVEYLAAVSGGNYVASAMVITAAMSDEAAIGEDAVWSRHSPEETYLRQHSDYLAPGLQGRLWMLANVTYGFIVNYAPFLLTAFLAGRLSGPLLRRLLGAHDGEPMWDVDLAHSRAVRTVLIWVPVVMVVTALGLVFRHRLVDGRARASGRGVGREGVAAWTFGVGVAVAGVVTAVPTVVALYGRASRWLAVQVLRQPAGSFVDGGAVRIGVAGLWLVLTLVMAATGLALSRHGRARALMLALAGAGASGMLVIPFVSAFEYSTAHGLGTPRDVAEMVGATAVILAMSLFVHNRRYSMHPFYRERLSTAYALERKREADGRPFVAPLPYDRPITFSEVGRRLTARAGSGARKVPRLVVCCAVNVPAREAPLGRFAGSFTFEAEHTGSPILDYFPTERFETDTVVPGTALTLPSMMAISGAALSPMMGRFTNPALRFLLAMTNVRLGVWITNPRQAPFEPHAGPDTRWHRMVRAVQAGWHEPGAWYVLREALGKTGLGTPDAQRRARRGPSVRDSKYIYVSDGGHVENLGLVELLRRRCTHILCFDASLDAYGSAADLGRAVAMARADLGVEIDIDPSPTIPVGDDLSEAMVATGRFRYPDGQEGVLVLTRCVLTAASSWDLHAFGRHDRHFPCHSTMQQVFSDDLFQAYRSLGHEGGRAALERLNLPPALLASARRTAGRPVTPTLESATSPAGVVSG